MNYVDIGCLLILFIYIFNAGRKGFVYLILSLAGKLLSIAASVFFCGTVSGILRQTPLFDILKRHAFALFKLDGIEEPVALMDFGGSIAKDTLSNYIMANNNSEIYKIFNAESFSDYLAGYIANVAINIISALLVFFCVSVIINIMFKVSGIITRFPVLKQVNALLNIAFGVFQATIVIWIVIIILMFFALQGMLTEVYAALLSSKIAIYFLKYNILAKIIFEVMI